MGRPGEEGTSVDRSGAANVRGITFVLRVSEGPDAGAAVVLDGIGEGRVLVGTSAVCTLRLTDPRASRRHAALRRETDAWRLEDLRSTNGTRVNGVRVQQAFLTGGELIAVGGTVLRLTRAGAAPVVGAPRGSFGGFESVSDAVRPQFAHWEKLAQSSLPILIEGETGTGKELLAEALHDASVRTGQPFVILECGRLLTERALGAALLGRGGTLEQARRGTLLVDEPAELDPSAQSVLAAELAPAALASHDVRLITISRRDLDHEVQAGRFREDLLYTLAGSTIELPPLRSRPGDVAMLTRLFWSRLGGAGAPDDELLASYEDEPWPGNVRELMNAVASRLTLGDPGTDAPPRPSGPPPALHGSDVITRVLMENLPFPRAREEVLHEFEERFVEKVLAAHGGNITRAAASSGLARRYFQILRARHPAR